MMKKMLFFAITGLLISCGKETCSYHELINYIQEPEHGLNQIDSINGVVYNIVYRPTDLLVWQEIQHKSNVSLIDIDSLIKAYSDYRYYLLNISAGNSDVLSGLSRQDFSLLLNEVSFNMPKYVYSLTSKKDTLVLADYSVPRFYGLGGATKVLLAFEKNGKEKEYEYEEIVIQGLTPGRVVFRYQTADIKRIPFLAWEKEIENQKILTK